MMTTKGRRDFLRGALDPRLAGGNAFFYKEATPDEGNEPEASTVLIVILLDGHRLEIFGFENLPAAGALDVIYAVAAHKELGSLMSAGRFHRQGQN